MDYYYGRSCRAGFRIPDQKTSFMDACRMRGAPALVICPKLLGEMLAFGAPKLGWFRARR